MQVEADDESDRIGAGVFLEARSDSGFDASAIAVAAVEDRAVVQHDRLAQTIRPNIGGPGRRIPRPPSAERAPRAGGISR